MRSKGQDKLQEVKAAAAAVGGGARDKQTRGRCKCHVEQRDQVKKIKMFLILL